MTTLKLLPKLFTKIAQVALIPLFLVTLLNGCASPQVQVKHEYIYPPQIYTVPCEQSEFTGTTYGEAITFLRIVMNERDICASRIKGIIDWETTTKNKP